MSGTVMNWLIVVLHWCWFGFGLGMGGGGYKILFGPQARGRGMYKMAGGLCGVSVVCVFLGGGGDLQGSSMRLKQPHFHYVPQPTFTPNWASFVACNHS